MGANLAWLFIGKVHLSGLHPYDAPEWSIAGIDGEPFPYEQLPFVRVIATGEPVFDVRHAIQWADGRRVELSINAAPMRDASGALAGVVATLADITAQRQVETRLRQAEKMEAIGQLAGGIAHDFNNQLAGVLGYAELLVGRLDDPTLRRYADGICTAARRAADLTQQLLAFARKGKYLNVQTDVHRVIAEAVELLKRSIDKRIEIKLHLEANPSSVMGDPTQLQNALLNLGLNARDAMPQGGELIFATRVVVFKKDSPAGRFLIEHGVSPADFNSYGARRGDWRVMVRGTFANIRLRNLLAPGTEGCFTTHLPGGEVMSIFDAAERYRQSDTPLLVLAGRDYGMGSSRDWAAKGTFLLGVKAVIAESFERIHRSNLVGMGVLPLVYMKGENRESLGLTGRETFDILGIEGEIRPGMTLEAVATAADGKQTRFKVLCRIDTPVEVEYYRHGGILHRVLRSLM